MENQQRPRTDRRIISELPDVYMMIPLVSGFAGPLATHVFAMTSAIPQRAYQLCKASCKEHWRLLAESYKWQALPVEMYYLWRLERNLDDDSTVILLTSLLGGRHIRRQRPGT